MTQENTWESRCLGNSKIEEKSRVECFYRGFSAMSLVFILVIEQTYNEPLFESSLPYIVSMQEEATALEKSMWLFYTKYVLLAVITLPIAICLAKPSQRKRAFYYTVLLTSIFFVMNMTKLWFHQARPFWVEPEIQAWSCSTQYGNPSGHSLIAMGMAMSLWLDYNHTVSTQDSLKDKSILSFIHIRIAFLCVALLFAASIGFSRVISGVHTWNQLILGWSLGLWIALTLHFVFKDMIMTNLEKLLDRSCDSSVSNKINQGSQAQETTNISQSFSQSSQTQNNSFFGLTLKWILFFFFVLTIETLSYFIKNRHIENDPLWSEQILAKCSDDTIHQNFQDKSMIDNGIIGLGFGAYFGLIFHVLYLPETLQLATEKEKWYGKPTLRILVGLVCCAILSTPFLLSENQIGNIYALALLKTLVPSFLSGFFMFGLLDPLCYSIGLLVKEQDKVQQAQEQLLPDEFQEQNP